MTFFTPLREFELKMINRVRFGLHSSEKIGEEAKKIGVKKCLVITDPGVLKAGLIEKIQISLENEKIQVD